MVDALGRPLAEAPQRPPSARCARPSARSPRPSSTTRTSACAPRVARIGLPPWAPRRKWVYDFSEGSREMRDLLGGKGANVAEMTRILGAERVPAGFTITTEACVAYMDGRRGFPDGLDDQVAEALARLEEQAGKRLGDADDPLLVSVRSGARESMPGMLDTVLNLGLNDESVAGPGRRRPATSASPGTPTGASCRCSATSCVGIDGRALRGRDQGASRRERGVTLDTELDVDALRELTATFQALLRLPGRPAGAAATARSGRSSTPGRASARSTYRRINRIPDDWGTAVNVQQMVFGNKGDTSGSGVAFSRDEVTGAPEPVRRLPASTPRARTSCRGVRNTARHRRAARAGCPRSTSS